MSKFRGTGVNKSKGENITNRVNEIVNMILIDQCLLLKYGIFIYFLVTYILVTFLTYEDLLGIF